MRLLMRLIVPLAVVLMLSSAAFAGAIVGSMGLEFTAPTMNGSDLSLSTIVGSDSSARTGGSFGCSGDYCVVPAGTPFDPFTLDLTTIGTGGGLHIVDGAFGGFTAGYGEIVKQDANFLDVYLEGTYSGLPGTCSGGPCTDSSTSFRASWTFTGSSMSGSGTLASPPAPPTPEPATMVLLGSALLGVGIMRRRRNV